MAEEGEVKMMGSAAHDAAPLSQNSTETGALVEVTFQKDPYQENKYLEAEPKVLGITQIVLSLFIMSIRLATFGMDFMTHFVIGSLTLFGVIAGSVAIAAQNLHLPTLKACLGVQLVMCVLSVVCFIDSSALLIESRTFSICWAYYHYNASETIFCQRLLDTYDHVIGVEMLLQAAQIALSATLAAFCCKVIQCCSPRPSVPVIAVNAPRAPQ